MRLTVKVKPNARHAKVEQIDASTYRVAVTVPPEAGKANDAMIALLAKHFRIAKSRITILRGTTTRTKLINVE